MSIIKTKKMTKSKKKEFVKKDLSIIIPTGHESDYIEYLNKYFNVTILDPIKVENGESPMPDLILFTGGADVNPEMYNEKTGSRTSVNIKRDKLEYSIFRKFNKIPKLGICRGAQFLTVCNDGKLIQHVENHCNGNHQITTTGSKWMYGSRGYEITSTHHQMMYPFNLPKDNYELIAWSTKFKSPTYLNGDNEEIKLDPNFLEPEIVFYPNTKSLCIQGHPEYGNCPEETKDYCFSLINSYLLKDN